MAVLVAACGSTEPEEPGWTVSGTAYLEGVGLNPSIRTPIQGVRLQLVTPPSAVGGGDIIGSAVSGDDGRFSIRTQPGQPRVCSTLIRLEAQAPTDYAVESVGSPSSTDCRGETRGLVVTVVPERSFREAASAEPADCVDLADGLECLEYEDGFIWLVETEGIQGWRAGRPWNADFQPTVVAVGVEFEFHHVLETNLVARVRLP